MKTEVTEYNGKRRIELQIPIPANKYKRANKHPDYKSNEGAAWRSERYGMDELYVVVNLTESQLRQALAMLAGGSDED